MRALLEAQRFLPLAECRILDVGCGGGKELARLVPWGARPGNMCGIDLLPARVEAAREAYPDMHFECGNAESLGFGDATFDLVMLFTVLSSILDERMASNVAREVARVLRPGGAVIWYDLRYANPYNPNVRGIGRRELQRLFPGFTFDLRSITMLPLLARRLGRLTGVLYPLLATLPFLRTHYLGLLLKPPTTGAGAGVLCKESEAVGPK